MADEKKLMDMILERYEASEKASIGRRSYATPTCCDLEISRHADNKPYLEEVVGLKWLSRINFVTVRVPPTATHLSSGGNGSNYYNLKPGFYIATGCLYSDGRIMKKFIVAGAAGVVTTTRRDFADSCVEYFTNNNDVLTDAGVTTKAALIYNEIAVEQKEVSVVVIDDYIVSPMFDEVHIKDVEALVRTKLTAEAVEEFIALKALNSKWSCNYSSGDTPEEAVEALKQKRAEREQAVMDAIEKSAALGLPALEGSIKQIAWALRIRDKVVQVNPADPRLKKATTARYWIDNRNHL